MKSLRSLIPILALLFWAFVPNVAVGAFGLANSLPAPYVPQQPDGQLGFSVAVGGTYVVVGSPYDDFGAAQSGVVEIFDADSGTLLRTLTNPSPGVDHGFGYSVAISGTRVVVGAPSVNPASLHVGIAYVYDLAGANPTVPIFTLNNPTPAKYDLYGYSVSISGDRVAIGAMRDDTVFVDAGAVHIYDISSGTPTTPVRSLFNPGPAGDYFGCAVSISGTRVVAGALRTDVNGLNDAGAAYVYDLASGTPATPIAVLPDATPATGDKFGLSVSISGSRVVVGAYQDDTGGSNAGSIYVYNMDGPSPTVPLTINNPVPSLQDHFGWCVSISGNLVIAGADLDDDGATDAGAAYVFDVTSGTPTVPIRELNNPYPNAADSFGFAVAVGGNRVAVGAPLDDAGAQNTGSAYAYDLNGATPSAPTAVLGGATPDKGSRFGLTVGLSGALVAVGAPYDEREAADCGRVYVYDRASATPTEPLLTFINPTPAAGDLFGYSVAISGTRLVVGAPGDDTGAADAGSAYVYDLAGGNPTTPVLTLNNSNPAVGDAFGAAVAIADSRVAIGAYLDDAGAANAGTVYVYDVTSGTPALPVATIANPDPTANDYFGASAALSGTRLVVGAYGDDTAGADSGAVYVFELSGGPPASPAFTLVNPGPAADDFFGASVGISGTRVVAGAQKDDTGASNSGSVYVYDLAGGSPTTPLATLINPSPGANEEFGARAGISGSKIIVAAPFDGAGVAYLFDLTSGAPGVPVETINNPSADALDGFGLGAAIDGNFVSIGAPGDDTSAPDQGFAYVFGPPPAGDIAIDGTLFVVQESAGVVKIPLVRTGGAGGSVTITLTATNGTAQVGGDFDALTPTPKVVTFADGVTEAEVAITLITPGMAEPNEFFNVAISAPTGGASLGTVVAARVVILDAETDKGKPTVAITTPAAGASISDSPSPTVSVTGKAGDNKGVAKVQVRLNDGEFEDAAIPENEVSNPQVTFSHAVEAVLGTNSLQVRSVDHAGNVSAVTTRTFTLIALRNLVVAINGPANSGSVSTGFLGTSIRQVGRSYSITATAAKTPAPGFMFAGWTIGGGLTAENIDVTTAALDLPALKFTFHEGLMLTANFVPYPFTAGVVGSFNGLILPSANLPTPGATIASHETVGMISATVSTAGSFSGKLCIDGLTLMIPGILDEDGVVCFGPSRAAVYTVVRTTKPSLELALQVDLSPTGSAKMTGTLTQRYRGAVRSVSLINADRAYYGATGPKVPESLAGSGSRSYTALFPSRDTQAAPLTPADYPPGQGFATVVVKTDGQVSAAGKLADGTAFTASSSLSKGNTWPLFQQLYKLGAVGRGCLAGVIAVDDGQAETDMLGTGVYWFRPFQLVQWYPYGWDEGVFVDFIAAKYTVPGDASVFPGLAAVDAADGNAELTFSGGLLGGDVVLPANITPANTVSKPSGNTDAGFVMKMTAASGLINGTFTHDDGTKPPFAGIIYQKGVNAGAYGWFLSSSPKVLDYLGEGGSVEILAK